MCKTYIGPKRKQNAYCVILLIALRKPHPENSEYQPLRIPQAHQNILIFSDGN